LLAWKSDHPAAVREYAESEQRALVLIAHFASRLSSRHAELLDEMATHNEWVVAFENLRSIIEYDWERLTAQDLALLEEVGADWEQPRYPINWVNAAPTLAALVEGEAGDYERGGRVRPPPAGDCVEE
jgi:hypothetical protein